MSKPNKRPRLSGYNRSARQSKNQYITKGGQKIKLHRNLRSRLAARKDARARKRAAYLATMPKERYKRILYRLHPKRVAKYWFSREGAIMALKITGIGILLLFLLLLGIFAYFRKDLPNLRDISGNNIGGSIRYYDKTGKTLLWEDYDAVKRTPVKDEDISQLVKDATVAVEDKDFFNHGGFDVRGIARAGFSNAIGKSGGTQGGSTITQQLVKLTQNWSKDRTYTRKVKELILSVELERSYTKKEILTGYLNTAPYGDITYGVEAATRDYFQKPAKDLTLDEAAFLAAIPKSPTYYSPYGARYDKSALTERQHYVLNLMAEQGKITNEQRDAAKKIDTVATIKPRQNKYAGIIAPWFVKTAKDQLQDKFGAETVNRGGWKVTTTLDMDLQKKAEEQVAKGLRQVQRQGGDTIAFAAEDVKTGQMVALVGGTDFYNQNHGENNYARFKLPPGSSFKPYDYASLIENTTNFGAGSVLYDSLGPIDGYPCTTGPKRENSNCATDYDLRYPGPLTLRYALGGSRNVPAMKAMLTAGVDKTREVAKKLMQSPGTPEGEARGDYNCYRNGVNIETATDKDIVPCGASAAIGDGAYLKLDENVHGFASLSRNGLNLPQTYILKIEDANNKTVDEWKPSKGVQAIRPDAAYIVSDMLSDPNASYFSQKSQRYKGWKFGFKTGTTNDQKDGWMMGMSTQYAAGTWVGYHNREREMTGAMETMTQPIMTGWMNSVHDNLKVEERVKPSGVQTLPAFVIRSHVGFGSIEPSPATDLYPSWYKANKASNTKDSIDIVSNKLATDCTPARARKDANNAAANQFSGDKFVPGGAGVNTTEKDNIHNCSDAKPSITLSAPASCDGSCSFTVTVTQGTHPLSSDRFKGTVNLLVDGQVVQTLYADSSPATLVFNYSGGSAGSHSVSADVVDSVLYDASDTATVAFSGTTSSITVTSAKTPGKFTWSGGSGTVTVYNGNNNTALCSSSSGSCTSGSTVTPGTPVYAKDGSGGRSDPVTTGSP
jgi:membrane peptidoglycan carboxypeptidase